MISCCASESTARIPYEKSLMRSRHGCQKWFRQASEGGFCGLEMVSPSVGGIYDGLEMVSPSVGGIYDGLEMVSSNVGG